MFLKICFQKNKQSSVENANKAHIFLKKEMIQFIKKWKDLSICDTSKVTLGQMHNFKKP